MLEPGAGGAHVKTGAFCPGRHPGTRNELARGRRPAEPARRDDSSRARTMPVPACCVLPAAGRDRRHLSMTTCASNKLP